MKVVGESASPVFPMRVRCRRVTDSYGFGYGNKIDFCGRELEIEAQDVKKHRWFKYPDYHGTDYGVVCPCCHQFVVIPTDELPKYVKENAPDIYLD